MARPTGESARDKLNIFLAIVPFVLSRKESSVAEIAEHFGVRPSIVAAAVSAIGCDGGAGEARHGFNNELFNIDWDLFLEDGTVILTVAETLRVSSASPVLSATKGDLPRGTRATSSTPSLSSASRVRFPRREARWKFR